MFQVSEHGRSDPFRGRYLIVESLLQALADGAKPGRLEGYWGDVFLGVGQARPFPMSGTSTRKELSVRRA